ncbi:MAG: hypothetical protein ABIW16_07080 [Sphingomicrobium sp.]
MRAGLRFGMAAAVALAFGQTPALAQDAAPPPPVAAPADNGDTVGPRELQNFSLNGSVTRRADTPPEPAPTTSPPAPTQTPSRQAQNSAPPSRTVASPVAVAPRPQQPVPTARPSPAPNSATLPSVGSTTVTLPPADRLSVPQVAYPEPSLGPDAEAAAPEASGGSFSPLPWLLALLALAGAAGWYFWRQRTHAEPAFAGASVEAFIAPRPAPAPRPVPPTARTPVPTPPLRPAPAPPPPLQRTPAPSAPAALGAGGVVSTRLRPWLEIEFVPGRCIVDEQQAVVEFDIALYNSGSGPARDVLIEAAMFNAGQTQDAEIDAFFGSPVAQGERIPLIQPFKRVALKSAVSLSRDQLRVFEAGERRLFVPLVGFNALYRWGGGEGQTSASYLVGREGDGDKMAPFRLDLGPRVFRGLGAREHELKVRA